ncbi:hypothetical protein XENTR_v10001743 [Xenopus tropicalis]|nr:hypothetical protein XENTR_v10001743 [Xenopus tropicalis]
MLKIMGEKESGDTPPGKPVTCKAGWLKKSSGLLGLWKDRHIVLLKTQLLLCESEVSYPRNLQDVGTLLFFATPVALRTFLSENAE